MTTIYSTATSLQRLEADGALDEAQLAAAAFLARYSGRTLDAYRHDLRGFFQWSADVGLTVLAATRAHIELYRGWMEDRGLAPRRSTGDCRQCAATTGSRTSTGASRRTPHSTSADPRCSQARATAWIAANLAPSCSLPSASITPTPRLPCSSG